VWFDGRLEYASDCWPVATTALDSYFATNKDDLITYSPAVACPGSWTSVGHSVDDIGSTRMNCCPSYVSILNDCSKQTAGSPFQRLPRRVQPRSRLVQKQMDTYSNRLCIAVSRIAHPFATYPCGVRPPSRPLVYSFGQFVTSAPTASTPVSSNANEPPASQSSKSLSKGAITGIVVSVTAALLLALAALFFMRRRKQQRQGKLPMSGTGSFNWSALPELVTKRGAKGSSSAEMSMAHPNDDVSGPVPARID
jgi:hypothetical protein